MDFLLLILPKKESGRIHNPFSSKKNKYDFLGRFGSFQVIYLERDEAKNCLRNIEYAVHPSIHKLTEQKALYVKHPYYDRYIDSKIFTETLLQEKRAALKQIGEWIGARTLVCVEKRSIAEASSLKVGASAPLQASVGVEIARSLEQAQTNELVLSFARPTQRRPTLPTADRMQYFRDCPEMTALVRDRLSAVLSSFSFVLSVQEEMSRLTAVKIAAADAGLVLSLTSRKELAIEEKIAFDFFVEEDYRLYNQQQLQLYWDELHVAAFFEMIGMEAHKLAVLANKITGTVLFSEQFNDHFLQESLCVETKVDRVTILEKRALLGDIKQLQLMESIEERYSWLYQSLQRGLTDDLKGAIDAWILVNSERTSSRHSSSSSSSPSLAFASREISAKNVCDTRVKLLMYGDSGVGKSCLIKGYASDYWTAPPYAENRFRSDTCTTIGVDFSLRSTTVTNPLNNSVSSSKNKKNINSNKNGEFTLKSQVWDTAGQERFRSITTAYFRGTNVIVLVYDVTDRQTFASVPNLLQQARDGCLPSTAYILLANKIDLWEKRVVSKEEGIEFAKKHEIAYFEVSARLRANIEGAFQAGIIEYLQKKAVEKEDKTGRITLHTEPVTQRKERSFLRNCC